MQANSVDLERLMKEVVDIEFRDTFRVAGEESTRKYTRRRVEYFCWPRLNLDRSGIFASLFPRELLLFSRCAKEIFFYPSTKEENTRSTIVAISWNIFISTFGRYRYRRAKMQKASMRVNSLLNASSLFVYEFIYSLREYLALYIRSRSRGEKEFVESRNYMGSRIKREILRGWSVAHARLKRIS